MTWHYALTGNWTHVFNNSKDFLDGLIIHIFYTKGPRVCKFCCDYDYRLRVKIDQSTDQSKYFINKKEWRINYPPSMGRFTWRYCEVVDLKPFDDDKFYKIMYSYILFMHYYLCTTTNIKETFLQIFLVILTSN